MNGERDHVSIPPVPDLNQSFLVWYHSAVDEEKDHHNLKVRILGVMPDLTRYFQVWYDELAVEGGSTSILVMGCFE